jgi:hypothetical protein
MLKFKGKYKRLTIIGLIDLWLEFTVELFVGLVLL